MRGWAGGPSWGGGEPWAGPQPAMCSTCAPAPGHTCAHTRTCMDTRAPPCASADVWSLLGAPLSSPRGPVPGQQLPPATSSKAQAPLTSPAQAATAPGKQGALWGVQPPMNQECKNGHPGNIWREPGCPWHWKAEQEPPGCQVQGGGPTAPPDIGGTWLFRCCPHPAPQCHRAGVSLGGSRQGAWEGWTLILPRGGRGGTVEGPGSPQGEWGVRGEQPSKGGIPSPLGVPGEGGAPAVCCVGSVLRSCCTLP